MVGMQIAVAANEIKYTKMIIRCICHSKNVIKLDKEVKMFK
jgi:hypothetical protein